MENQLHRSTYTTLGRNANMFKKIKALMPSHGPINILSFGCSKGDEIVDLLNIFETRNVIGVDIHSDMVMHATSRFTDTPKVSIYQSSKFNYSQFRSHFDLIVCCNVLCNFSTAHDMPLPMPMFSNSIAQLWNMVKCNGYLFVRGANYLAQDVIGAEEFKLELLCEDSGQVPCYRIINENIVKLPRNEAKLHVLQKVARKSNTMVPPPAKLSKETSKETSTETSIEESPTTTSLLDNIQDRSRHVTFGILCYRSSKNIGDYGQTIAQLNILSRFYRPSWHIESPVLRKCLEWLSSSKPGGPGVRQRNYGTQVTVVWVERDTTHAVKNPSHDGLSCVYLIANGWYMHPDKNKVFQWPFADWLRPFLISMHIAQPKMLDLPGSREYMIKFGPVGCRDRDTELLLRNLNIPCFFSGCLTWTLESVDISSFSNMERLTNYKNDILKDFVRPDDVSFSHTMPAMLNQSFDEHLAQAMDIYKNYIRAKSIQSTRIHTLMPALALGAENLWFSSPSCSNDTSWNGRSRFSGLKNFMDQPITRNVHAYAVCERLTETIDRLLVDGLDGQDLQEVWRGRHYESLVKYDQDVCNLSETNSQLPFRWSAWRKLHKGTVTDINQGHIDSHMQQNQMMYFNRKEHADKPVTTFTVRNVPIHSFPEVMNIVLTFDMNFIQYVRPFLANLSIANKNTLFRCFCFTRDIKAADFKNLCKYVLRITNVILFDIPMVQAFANYKSSLEHVNVTCMDRILIPNVSYPVDDVVQRIIYLDLDMLIYGDISEFNRLCTGRKGIVAKPSKAKNIIKNWLGKIGSKAHYYPDHSFNFGIAIMDIDKLKQCNFVDTCLTFHENHNGANDQIISNLYCMGMYKKMAGKYNVFVGQDDDVYTLTHGLENTGVVYHFAGSKKPWNYASAEEYPHNKDLWKLWNVSERRLHDLENDNAHFIPA